MLAFDIIFALIFAFILTGLLVVIYGRGGPGKAGGILLLLALLFFGLWAGGAWIAPFGPIVGGISIFPLLAALFAVLLLLLAALHQVPFTRNPASRQETNKTVPLLIGLTAYLTLFVLVMAGLAWVN